MPGSSSLEGPREGVSLLAATSTLCASYSVTNSIVNFFGFMDESRPD